MLAAMFVSVLVFGAFGMVSAAKNRKEDAAIDKRKYEWWKNFVNNLEGPTQSQLWLELIKDDAEGNVDKDEIRRRHDALIAFNKRTYQGFEDLNERSVESRTPELAVAA